MCNPQTLATPAFQAKPATTFGLINWKITRFSRTLLLRIPQNLVGIVMLWAHYTIAVCSKQTSVRLRGSESLLTTPDRRFLSTNNTVKDRKRSRNVCSNKPVIETRAKAPARTFPQLCLKDFMF